MNEPFFENTFRSCLHSLPPLIHGGLAKHVAAKVAPKLIQSTASETVVIQRVFKLVDRGVKTFSRRAGSMVASPANGSKALENADQFEMSKLERVAVRNSIR